MAAIESIRRVLMPGLVFGALIVAATASSAGPLVPGAPAGALGTLLYVQGPGGSDALLRFAHKSPFCRWHPGHRLCAELVALLTFCDRRPDHRLCQPPDHDRFCKSHRGHPLCDDDRFCDRRPDHPLCDNDQPPSPS